MLNTRKDYRLLFALVLIVGSFLTTKCHAHPMENTVAPRHACKWKHCPMKGQTIHEFKEAHQDQNENDWYKLDVLHMAFPAADYDQLDSMLEANNSQVRTIAYYYPADTVRRCKGTTKAGNPCRSTFVGKDGYCRYHSPSAIHCAHPGCKMVVKEAGMFCRFHNSHAVRIDKEFPDEKGYVSVWFTQDGKARGLDHITAAQYDSLIAVK